MCGGGETLDEPSFRQTSSQGGGLKQCSCSPHPPRQPCSCTWSYFQVVKLHPAAGDSPVAVPFQTRIRNMHVQLQLLTSSSSSESGVKGSMAGCTAALLLLLLSGMKNWKKLAQALNLALAADGSSVLAPPPPPLPLPPLPLPFLPPDFLVTSCRDRVPRVLGCCVCRHV